MAYHSIEEILQYCRAHGKKFYEGVLIPLFRSGQAEHGQIVKSLYVSAGIGQVIAARAFIALRQVLPQKPL